MVSELVSRTASLYETTIVFSPLNTTDTGAYACEALVVPDPESDFINMSMMRTESESITVEG